MNYKIAFDRLTEAYIKGEVNPLCPCACFVGNLLNKKSKWTEGRHVIYDKEEQEVTTIDENIISRELIIGCIEEEADGFYTPEEIILMEGKFIDEIDRDNRRAAIEMNSGKWTKENEEALFRAFEKTLEYLKQIHIAKGENIDEEFKFIKRKTKQNDLQTTV